MLDYKLLSTPMSTNEKLSRYDNKEKVHKLVYQSLVRLLIYVINTRPNMFHSISIVCQFISEPSISHFAAAKRILGYIKWVKNMWSSIQDRRIL